MDRMELFARIQLEQEETILLIIDIQTKLMAAMDARDQVCQNTGILLTTARELQIPVVVTEQYPRGLGPSVPELVQQLPSEVRMLEKSSFDAARSGLLSVLDELGRHSVIICGTEAHICVYQTTRSLLEQGYRVFPIEDAICSRAPCNYQCGLALMNRMGAWTLTTEGRVFDLLKASDIPGFKTISKDVEMRSQADSREC